MAIWPWPSLDLRHELDLGENLGFKHVYVAYSSTQNIFMFIALLYLHIHLRRYNRKSHANLANKEPEGESS
jgi:hypothetical protein